MAADPTDAALEREMDMLAQRAGLDVPPERRAALLAGFKDLKRMLGALHGPHEETADLSAHFDPRVIERQV